MCQRYWTIRQVAAIRAALIVAGLIGFQLVLAAGLPALLILEAANVTDLVASEVPIVV